MAVLVESISVIIKAESIHQKYPGGWEAFREIVPNQTLCADNELVRIGFMTPTDVESFISKLQSAGLVFSITGEASDIAVADQMRGFTTKCCWAEFGRTSIGANRNQEISACRLIGSKVMQVVTPPSWKFEGSLSQTYGFVPNSQVSQTGFKFLRHENGLDVYFDSLSGKEVFVARTESN